jgi:hypothetical protein
MFSADFIVFEYVGNIEQPPYVMIGWVKGSPSGLVKLVEKRVRETAEMRPEANERGIHAINVYEV